MASRSNLNIWKKYSYPSQEKLDRILAAVDAKNAERIIRELDAKYPRK